MKPVLSFTYVHSVFVRQQKVILLHCQFVGNKIVKYEISNKSC